MLPPESNKWDEVKPEPPKPEPDVGPGTAFYNHLDGCARCNNEPFNLCSVGDKLVRKAVESITGAKL